MYHEREKKLLVLFLPAYRANRATGETLPSLLYAQDVSHFHAVLHQIRSIDDANRKKIEIEQQQQIEKNPAQQGLNQARRKCDTFFN